MKILALRSKQHSKDMSAGGCTKVENTMRPAREDGEAEPAAHVGSCAACRAALAPERHPHLLPCLHSLCAACLPRSDGPFVEVCPACKSIYTHLTVKTNPFIKEMPVLPETQMTTKCAGCEDMPVNGWCKECGEALCAACVSAHGRVRVTRKHTILQQPSGSPAPPFCLTHKEEQMKLFCLSCDQLTCRDCQLTKHRNHRFKFIQEAAAAMQVEMRSLMEKVKHQKESVKQSLHDLDGRLLDLTAQEAAVKKELRNTIICIRNEVVKHALRLGTTVQELCESERVGILVRKEELRQLEQRQNHMLGFTELVLNADNHTAQLVCKKQIEVQLLHLLSHTTAPPPSMLEMKFCRNKNNCTAVARFGKIVMKDVPFAPSVRHHAPSQASDCPPQTKSLNTSCTPKAPTCAQNRLAVSSPIHDPPPPIPQASTSFSSPIASLPPQPSSPSAIQPNSVSSSEIHGTFLACPPRQPDPSPALYLPIYRLSQSPSLSFSHSNHYASSAPIEKNVLICTSSNPYPNVNSPQTASVAHYSSSASKWVVTQKPPSVPVPVSSWSFPSVAVGPPVSVNTDEHLSAYLAITSIHPVSTSNQALPAAGQTFSHCTELPSSADPVQPAEGMLPKKPQSTLLVKAPADSPCETVPPAGKQQEAESVPSASENEPTSTVMEVNSTLSCEKPVIADLANSQPISTDPGLTTGITSHVAMELNSVITSDRHTASCEIDVVAVDMMAPSNNADTSLVAGTTTAANRTAAADTVKMYGSSGQEVANKTNIVASRRNSADPPDLNGSIGHIFNSEHGSKELSHTGCVHLPASSGEKKASCESKSVPRNVKSPLDFGEVVVGCHVSPPPANLLAPSEAQDQNVEDPTSSFDTLSSTDQVEVRATEDPYRCPVEEDKSCTETAGIDNVQDSRSPVSRCMLPQVSLYRIPISAPTLGSLPRFRLIPGTTNNEILLEMIEKESQPVISPESTSERVTQRVLHFPKPATRVCCPACCVGGELICCMACGRSFHKNCHIPPINASVRRSRWRCMLCWNSSDVGHQYSTLENGSSSLSLLDQKKCEHVLLVLMCTKYSSLLHKAIQGSTCSSQCINIILIRKRLLQKLKPPYQTPSEFVSDVWVLLDTLLKNSNEPSTAVKLQKCFEETLTQVFGQSLRKSLLKCPCKKEKEGIGNKNTLKRLREFLNKNPQKQAKRVRTESSLKDENGSTTVV